MSTNQHSATKPSPPICVFLMTRHSVISFRLKRWVQAVSHTCPGQRFLERASTRLHRVYVITKVVWYRSEIVATILFTTLQFPQFIPNLWTIGSSISLSFGSFSQNWARNSHKNCWFASERWIWRRNTAGRDPRWGILHGRATQSIGKFVSRSMWDIINLYHTVAAYDPDSL